METTLFKKKKLEWRWGNDLVDKVLSMQKLGLKFGFSEHIMNSISLEETAKANPFFPKFSFHVILSEQQKSNSSTDHKVKMLISFLCF